MKTKYLLTLMLAAGITVNVYADANKPPPEPQDVNVVNTPHVTVTNPQTSVTVDNTTPIPVNVQGDITTKTERVFVGFSNETRRGDAGYSGMHHACENTYGVGALMCTAEEAVHSAFRYGTSETPYGWVDSMNDTNNHTLYIENPNSNCDSWKTTNASGTVLTSDLWEVRLNTYSDGPDRFKVPGLGCSASLPVACCK